MVRAVSTLAVVALTLLARVAGAADKPAIVVDLIAAPDTPAWAANAYEQTIQRELSGFDRIAARPKAELPAHGCAAEATTCRLRAYQHAGIDLVLLGAVDERAAVIRYELAQTWTPARIATGEIAIGRAQTAIGLTHAVREALRPVLTHGGLLDQRPYAFDRVARERTGAGWELLDALLLGGLAFALVLPFVLLGALGRVAPRRLVRLVAARRVLALLAGIAGLALVMPPNTLAGLVERWPWVFAGLGGLAWGIVLITVGKAVFPPLDGLERIPARDVRRVVGTWCLLCGERLLLLGVLYAPLGLAVAAFAGARGISPLWAVALLAPALALAARLAYAAAVECIALALDRRYVDGEATSANPWSREVGVYLTGYVRRTGWDLDPQLLATTVFLPGAPGTGVITYGGGTTHARVVVERALLELAIGPLAEVKPDEQPVLWPDWAAAVVVAGGQARRTRTGDDYRARKVRPSHLAAARKPLGRPATLLGHVLPAPGQVAPLISDNLQDLAVVRELLSEHYAWYAPDPDDEWDPTDPTDKDFLFGALVRELGVVRRGETQLETLKWLFGPRVGRITSRYRARIADAYAALNFARHHLIQFLHGIPELYTARARPARLEVTSTTILAAIAARPVRPPRMERASRRRLVWLSRFFAQPLPDPGHARTRRIALAVIAAIVAGSAGIAVERAVAYHDTYVQRTERGSHGQAKTK